MSNNPPEETTAAPNVPTKGGTSPCQRLKNLVDPAKANVKTLITGGMYDYINNSSVGEAGVYLKKDANGAYTNEVAPYTGTASLTPKFGGDYYSTIHTHPKSTYPMFSYSDLVIMYKLEVLAAVHNKKQSSFLLVSEDINGVKQTYAVVFESTGLFMEDIWDMPEFAGFSLKQKVDALDEKLRLAYDNELLKTNSDPSYQPNYERVFLQFCFGTNIGLYKADPNLTSWSKLTIATNSDTAVVTPTNCN
ncbi:hypothetical protein [Chryseobacterium aquaticum]|uniref:hypothetical protein n=1 Tax=Chryseobacterium aquaticum TaxID=452084 RepID=UPI003F72EB6F